MRLAERGDVRPPRLVDDRRRSRAPASDVLGRPGACGGLALADWSRTALDVTSWSCPRGDISTKSTPFKLTIMSTFVPTDTSGAGAMMLRSLSKRPDTVNVRTQPPAAESNTTVLVSSTLETVRGDAARGDEARELPLCPAVDAVHGRGDGAAVAPPGVGGRDGGAALTTYRTARRGVSTNPDPFSRTWQAREAPDRVSRLVSMGSHGAIAGGEGRRCAWVCVKDTHLVGEHAGVSSLCNVDDGWSMNRRLRLSTAVVEGVSVNTESRSHRAGLRVPVQARFV